MPSAAPTPPASPYKRALGLSAFLFIVFVVATGLYARYGYAFALRVYEQQQLANVERATGSGKLVEYEDYLRVDPTNLYMRGLLINQLIEFKNPWRALEVALEGVAAVPPDQRPIAKLLVGRAQIARGKLDEAEATYNEVLETLGESGEAHYGLASIAAAQGDFESMKSHFDWYFSLTFLPSSSVDVGPGIFRVEPSSLVSPNSTNDFNKRLHSDPYLYLPIDMEQISDWSNWETGNESNGLFWRGVYEEEQGNRDTALDFYRRAADAGDVLGKFAAERLAPAPPTEEPEAEE